MNFGSVPFLAAVTPAPAPPAGAVLVQSTGVSKGNWTSVEVAFSLPVTPGNTIVVFGGSQSSPVGELSSNVGDTFTHNVALADDRDIFISHATAVGGSTTLSLFGGAETRYLAQEWSGLTYDAAAGTATSSGYDDQTVSTPNTSSTAASVVFSIYGVRQPGDPYTDLLVPSGFTEVGRDISAGEVAFAAAYRADTTASVKAATWVDAHPLYPDTHAAMILVFSS